MSLSFIASAIESNDLLFLPKFFDIKFIKQSRDNFRQIAHNSKSIRASINSKNWADIVLNLTSMSLCDENNESPSEQSYHEFQYYKEASNIFLQIQDDIDLRCAVYKSICQSCLYYASNSLCYKDASSLLRKLYAIILNARTQAQIITNNPCLAITNTIVKINLMNNNYNLAEKTFDSLSKSFHLDPNAFTVSDLASFYFLKGKVDMVYGNRHSAYQEFKKSLQYLPLFAKKDRRLVLVHFIPVSLSFGEIPTDELLKQYDLYELYSDFTTAISTGNLELFNQALNKNQSVLIHFGVWEMIIYSKRMVFRRILQMFVDQNGSNKVYIEGFRRVLSFFGHEYSYEEAVLEIANLIYDKLAMANIAYQNGLIVFKAGGEFSLPNPEDNPDE